MNGENLTALVEDADRYYLKPGFVFVSEKAAAIHTVLGSCVAVCVYDRRRRYGGMNHFMLPRSPRGAPTSKFGDAAMAALFKTFNDFGSRWEDLEAQLYGGSWLANNRQSREVGTENVQTARSYLRRYGIALVSEDVGGILGRKIVFLSELNRVFVYKLSDIRKADYFDYRDPRRELYGRAN